MGYFIEIQPSPPQTDIMERYHIPDRAERGRLQCEHVDPDGKRCAYHTVLREAEDGKRYCFFHHADSSLIAGQDPDFDRIQSNIAGIDAKHEEECSIYYYHDNYQYIKANQDRIDTIIEVGCYLGGLSAVFAQAAKLFGCRHYIVEFNLDYLLTTYERIARIAPECLDNVVCYHGTFAEFVADYGEALQERSTYLEIDAAHTYEGVLDDLTTSYEISRGIHSIACHDFHLRSADWKHDLFVDRAIFSVFGVDAVFRNIGFNTGDWVGDPDTDFSGNRLYNKRDCFEGVIINLAENAYCFDRIAKRPPLRILLRNNFQQWKDWARDKTRARFGPKTHPPVYEPQEVTDFKVLFAVQTNHKPETSVEITIGESFELSTYARTFAQYDNGKLYRELGKEEIIKATDFDEGILSIDGTVGVGLKVGVTTVRFAWNDYQEAEEIEVTVKRPEDVFFETMAKLPAARILEIGSRTVISNMPRKLAGPNATFVGLDLIDGNNVDVVGDAHNLAELFEEGEFDGIYSASVFEHIPIPWGVALGINRVLRRGGLVYIASHHSYPLHEMPWDFWRYGKGAFRTLFNENTGFYLAGEGLRWPANLCESSTQKVLPNGEACHLFSDVLARKHHDYDPGRYAWDFAYSEILPQEHFYPEETGYSDPDPADKTKPHPVLSHPTGSPKELADRFLKSLEGKQSPKTLFLIASGSDRDLAELGLDKLAGEKRNYHNTEEARALYDLPKEVGKSSLDAIVVLDVLGRLESPWLGALAIRDALRPGAPALIIDSQVRPRTEVPDLWRISSEGFRILFNPLTGFDLQDAILADPCALIPDDLDDPMLKFYDVDDPCYRTSMCLLRKTYEGPSAKLSWG